MLNSIKSTTPWVLKMTLFCVIITYCIFDDIRRCVVIILTPVVTFVNKVRDLGIISINGSIQVSELITTKMKGI